MVEGDDGEHTRFPCLAIVRYMVATVVTVLTIVVVVMVFIDGLRPEEIRLSVVGGYISADRLMSVTETVKETPGVTRLTTPYMGNCRRYEGRPYTYRRPYEPCSGGKVRQLVKTYQAADSVNLRVILSAHNPSGRASVNCTITTIRVLDMPNAPLFTEMEEIVWVDFNQQQQQQVRFSVPRQTSHTLTNFVTINNTSVLVYIFERYLAKSSFSALVEVNSTVSYKPLSSLKAQNISRLHYCWPVTVGSDTLDDTDVTCKTSKEIDLPVNPQFPAPAPAPAAPVEINY